MPPCEVGMLLTLIPTHIAAIQNRRAMLMSVVWISQCSRPETSFNWCESLLHLSHLNSWR